MKQQYRLTANADLRSRNTFGISARGKPSSHTISHVHWVVSCI